MPVSEHNIQRIEADIQKLFNRTEPVATIQVEVEHAAKAIESLSQEVKELRRSLMVTALSVASSSILVAATVFLVFR